VTPFDLHGSVAVVTGALGRLGPVWCGALLDAGARVLALDLPGTVVPSAFEDLQGRHGPALSLRRADVTDRGALARAQREVAAEMGAATILVNNAGIDQPPGPAPTSRIEDIPVATFQRVLEVNVTAAFQVIQVFGPPMLELGRGSIINIGSLYAAVSPDQRFYDHLECDPPFLKPPAYGASKSALVNLTRYLATHWAPRGVRVNTLSPGGVLAEQDPEFKRKFVSRVPLGRMAVASDLTGPLVFLASPAAAYITGIELRVDGGYTAW
jgi:NAD(P)-dependent dehydrogenase (short-subunit alcohol dehydrogenase family)